jgi:hypothetical protein
MTLTRSRKLILGILALAIVALVVDRLVLAPSASGPRHAGAAETTNGNTAEGGAAPPADAGAPPEPDPGARLAARLETTAARFELDPAALRDGFVPAAAWLEELVEPVPEPEAPAPPVSPAQQFAQQHTLTSVIMTSRGGSAVVDGKVVPVGQAVDGFRLVRLTRHSAVFESGGEQVELRLRR